MVSNNLVQLKYESLDWENGNFNAESLEKLTALLKIRREGNVIYICHPKHLFEVMTEDPDTKEIKHVDFDSINIEKLIKTNDFGRYSIVEQICSPKNNQFTYIMKKASHMIRRYQEKGVSKFSYPFVILEEIYNGVEGPQYFVRGIVNCSQEGFSLAFNPLAIKDSPKESVWQKALRFGDNFD